MCLFWGKLTIVKDFEVLQITACLDTCVEAFSLSPQLLLHFSCQAPRETYVTLAGLLDNVQN